MSEHLAGKELSGLGQLNGLFATVVNLQVNLVVLADAVMLFFEAANALPKFIGCFSVRGRCRPSAKLLNETNSTLNCNA